jgi:hypothetical protein
VRNLTQEKSSVMIGREIDARSTYKRRMDKELEVMRNEFTIGDVEFDQNFLRKHPESSICQMTYVEPASITMFVRSVHELCEGLKSKWRFHKTEESCVYVVDEDKHTVEFRRPADAFEVTCAVTQKAKGIR